MNIREPRDDELQTIEYHLRLMYAKAGHVPKKVRLARGEDELRSAWRGEATRFYYLVVRKQLEVDERSFIIVDDDGTEIPSTTIDSARKALENQ